MPLENLGRVRPRARSLLILVSLAALTTAACGDVAGGGSGSLAAGEGKTLRLGYFPNVTHAGAIIGIEQGFIQEGVGGSTKIEIKTFNAGGEAIEALFSGAIDATFIGPNPAVTGYAGSNGEALRVVAGATSGGAALVVAPEIEDPQQLRGKTLSTPALGNTQDVALRAWLGDQGMESTLEGGGDVSIMPQDNALIFESFRDGKIAGAWVPEPWSTRILNDAGGKILVDEADLWPGGRFVTTHLVVETGFLEDHADVTKGLIEGHIEATHFVNKHPERAQNIVQKSIEEITGSEIADETIAGAWENLSFTVDPIVSSLRESADDAVEVGLLDPVDLDGIHDLTLLNEILRELGREEVAS